MPVGRGGDHCPQPVRNRQRPVPAAHDRRCIRYDLTDARIGAFIAEGYLKARFVITKDLGWMEYDGKRWGPVGEPVIFEQVRLAVLDIYTREVLGVDEIRAKPSPRCSRPTVWVRLCASLRAILGRRPPNSIRTPTFSTSTMVWSTCATAPSARMTRR